MRERAIPERHRRVAEALRHGGPATPDGLRSRLQALEPRPPEMRRAAFPRSVPRLLAPVAGVAALVVVVVVVVLSLGGPAGPSLVQAAEIAQLPANEPTPAPDRANPTVLEKHLEGVTFPDWSKKFGWRAEGARTDRLDGRRAETVFYTHHGHRIGYTVISGEPLEPPEGAQTIRRNGVEIHRYKDGDRTVVTFERGGLTCILSGHVVHADTPLKLAAWKGSGAIRF
ncbi:MAG TPA: hypothetical protein VI122_14745 [Thermoleophilaceae bacterium]